MPALIFSLLLHAALAADPHLPPVTAPVGIEEGVEIKLTEEQAESLLPWAENSKTQLLELRQSVEGSGNAESLARLSSGIQKVIDSSHPKHPELLMRYVLSRGLLVDKKLAGETDPTVPGVLRIRKKFLLSFIDLALKYYKSDISLLLNKEATSPLSRIDFASFGLVHVRFLQKLSRRIFDSSAQYQIVRLNLGLLHWDLYRDLENKKYAPVINKIHQHLKRWPEVAPPEAEARVMTRQMRKLLGDILRREFAENLFHCGALTYSSREICRNHVKTDPDKNWIGLAENLSRCDELAYYSQEICRNHIETDPYKDWSELAENLSHCDALKSYDLTGTYESQLICRNYIETDPDKNWSQLAENLSHCNALKSYDPLATYDSQLICRSYVKTDPDKDLSKLAKNLSRCNARSNLLSQLTCLAKHARN